MSGVLLVCEQQPKSGAAINEEFADVDKVLRPLEHLNKRMSLSLHWGINTRICSLFIVDNSYGHTVKSRLVFLLSILVSISMLSTATHGQSMPTTKNIAEVEPTQVVSFRPYYGYSPQRISARLSQSEVRIIKRMQALADTWSSITPPPVNLLNWRIEPAVAGSPTVNLAIDAFHEARAFLSVPFNSGTVQIAVIIGRTQQFIQEQVSQVGCKPTLATSNGIYLMGATICNRNVIVINLTGYLFLRSVTQPITSYMESRKEPSLSSTSYLIVDRNLSSLAHEWTHVARNRLSDGFVPDNEPAWFREGLAEIISGLARVKASKGKYRYTHFHIIRLRKFANWPNICGLRLYTFRVDTQFSRGCEYLSGAAALELLIAKYGGLPKILELYANIRVSGDFLESFKRTYRMSLREFERRADIYATYISQVAARR